MIHNWYNETQIFIIVMNNNYTFVLLQQIYAT